MKEKPLRIEYGTSNASSPEDNILRGLFTFFLNTGAMDGLMAAASLQPASARTDHVGAAFLKLHGGEFRDGFVEWAESDALASFLLSNKGVKDALRDRFRDLSYSTTLTTIAGTRFKELTGFDRKRMPKDLKKSFYTKAYNRLVKFCEEWRSPQFEQRPQASDLTPGERLDVDGWLRLALSKRGKKLWFQSENLREIRNMYWKTMKHEPVEDVVEELLRQAAVAGVMLS